MAGPAGGMTVRDAGGSAAALRDRRLDGRAFVMGASADYRTPAVHSHSRLLTTSSAWPGAGTWAPRAPAALGRKQAGGSRSALGCFGPGARRGRFASASGPGQWAVTTIERGLGLGARRPISAAAGQGDRCPRCGLTGSAAQVDDGHGRVQAGPSRLLHLSRRAPAAVCHPRPADGPADSPLATAWASRHDSHPPTR
ncbi:hypothetical protein COCC4DRAFT_23486 [Bipolaris maydis ATCC 48331]|uniref:Uncharacterized protein n=2 Tax=Cochliobolus heterostrophus TaxID=5016 RepID=M2SVC2_COCH5|nr:uncharacterized protein COCC4DRAFT_23486 [Bipolaris maydis ATCC 48331]EMD89305.1 hypothetical protein COCHEDRAFT_1032354 [Bipolaris maydis C5]ENI04978.1 hypothetical protein COCC4DRAFT_23486 [Bipolaris maydis ATCC 48331]